MAEGRLQPSGKAIYEKRNLDNIARTAYEQKETRLKPEFEKQFQINRKAWDYFSNRTASYNLSSINPCATDPRKSADYVL